MIPTWDRPESVNQRLHEIDEIWNGLVNVKIQVNPGNFSAKDIDVSLYSGHVEVCENAKNIGLFANVVCGVHGIRTKWLWILGDDDSLKPDSRQIVEQALAVCERDGIDAILFNQWEQPDGRDLVICDDLQAFTRATSFGNPLFISTNLWRTSFFQSRLGLFVEYSFSVASHVLLYIAALHEKASRILVINKPLINYDYHHRWSRTGYLQRVFFLFRHPGVWQQRSVVMDFLWPQARWALLSAVHEQLKNGEVTLYEWIHSAFEVTRFQFLCAQPITALQRTFEIASFLLEAYSLPRIAGTISVRIWKALSGQKPLRSQHPQQELGL